MFFFRKPGIWAGAFLAGLAGLTFPGSRAQADLQFSAETNVGNLFTYDLNFNNSTDASTGLPSQRLQSGNFATLYDINGFNSATLNTNYSSLFTLTTQPFGITAPGTLPGDDTPLNITLTYHGPTVTADQSFQNILQVNSSIVTVNPEGQYTSVTTNNLGVNTGSDVAAIGTVAVPGIANINAVTTPEPGSVALFLGAGISASLFGYRRRRNRK